MASKLRRFTKTLKPLNPINPSPQTLEPTNQSQYRKQILLTNLLLRYGFPPSNPLSKNKLLLNSNLSTTQTSLNILSSLKLPHKSLISLITNHPHILHSDFLTKWKKIPLLEHSIRTDPEKFFECLNVFKSLGFCDSTVSKILSVFPCVNEVEIRKKIEFLIRFGNNIERLCYVFPEVLGFSVEARLEPLVVEFKRMGFSDEVIKREIGREPRVLGLELGELSRCVELVNALKCREVIKVGILREGVFRAGWEVKRRVDCLCGYGLIRRDAFKVVWKEPRVVLYRVDEIEKKIEFLVERMGFDVSCLVDVPEYLGVSLEKQIVPRFNVVDYLKVNGGLGCDIGLKGLIKPSMNKFYNLYVKPYPECERIFGMRKENVRVKQRHPAGLWKLMRPPSHVTTKDDVVNMKSFVESLA